MACLLLLHTQIIFFRVVKGRHNERSQAWSKWAKDGRRHRQRHGRSAFLRKAGRVRHYRANTHRHVLRRAACGLRPRRPDVVLRAPRCGKADARAAGVVRGARHRPAHRRSGQQIDRQTRLVRSDKGVEIAYDTVVLATGSYPFVPPVPGIDKRGVFVYRTIEDLERIIDYGKRAKRAAVIGGGLLGLEAAKAAYDLGLETHVDRICPAADAAANRRGRLAHPGEEDRRPRRPGASQQIDEGSPRRWQGRGDATSPTASTLDVDMIIVSAGIRPRDDLARACGLEVGERGGMVVNDRLQTSDPHIYRHRRSALLHGG